ncbi:MAG: hypothetical protein AB7V13_05030 [Pseudorhodoplanes sp.]|uniref:COG3904 family protein n=1 Tax=Pseudorhodoplanes sp. TaxID=1934341 RepID=UPI003D12D5CB
MAADSSPVRNRLINWLQDRPDDHLLRGLFAIMVTATMAVIALDYVDMLNGAGREARTSPGLTTETATPSAEPLPSRRSDERGPGILRTADNALGAPVTFELAGDGRLIATGTIVPGAADAFAAEIDKRGGYVKTVVLHSPGGSVQDALKIGRMIRDRNYNTEVMNGRYCASSCPLIFAGGVERIAGRKASIGVHQVSALTSPGSATMADGMRSAQRVSAEVQRYLRDMGVDSQVWVHAMETPANELFYFKPDELLALKLATPGAS